ncbi:unnamed protein product [Parascedosporium putredinis]|uniref:Uncharacterized protein n=1 Tax=Parascedosporium putredinis TaxID=1442378 RepID=A0A9P1MB59_9PEZI|nr:unnamed protein product [Parascedosporium putredinis]CAI7998889.1 unnamed protein product [Parascedosporium putredinis]
MESSPLTKAHDYALAASKATKAADTTVAVAQHTLAAGEFSNAAQNTNCVEALRTLKLLEEHHRRLSELLRFPADENSSQPSDAGADADADTSADAASDEKQAENASQDPAATEPLRTGRSATKAPPQVPSLLGQRRQSSRDLTSSIASNLASARGIRFKYGGQPLSPSVSNDPASGNLETPPRRRDGSRSKMQNMLEQPPKPVWSPHETLQKKSESLSRESSESGKGHPPRANQHLHHPKLRPQTGTAASLHLCLPTLHRTRSKQDLLKAALRFVSRDGYGANDSFYVVPTTGHTMSYANILTFAEKEKRRMEASLHGSSADTVGDEDDDFVDARETPMPLSPVAKRRIGKGRTERDLNNAIEELCTENKGLKDMLDKLSKRLHAFEASAQNSSLALAESMRLMRPGSPLASAATARRSSTEEALKRQNAELEEKLAAAVKHVEMLEKDNQKMQKTLAKYREKWEQLKESAKARRGGQGPGAAGGSGTASPAAM